MHIKTNLKKHRLSFLLSWLWALTGFAALAGIAYVAFLPSFVGQFGDNPLPVLPMLCGAAVCYFAVGGLMISGRRLPYSNNFENLFLASLCSVSLLLIVLAAAREFYSGTFLTTCLCFQVLWYELEVFYRNRFVEYQFALFPSVMKLAPDDFHEYKVHIVEPVKELPLDDIDAVIVDFNIPLDAEWTARLAKCQEAGIPVIPLEVFLENVWGRIPVEMFNSAVVLVDNATGFRPYRRMVKPVLEWLAAALGLIVVSPVLAVTALVVKLTSPGPVLFCQERVGLNGKPFTIYKFRTMLLGMERLGVFPTADNDERLTRVGGFLRKYHIDELPQLLNVLKGDMAIVGPRPEIRGLSEFYSREIPGYGVRNTVRPGVTSWALIHQGNVSGVKSTRIKLSYDLFYLKHASCFLDFYIVMKTVWVMLIGIETLSAPNNLSVFGPRKKKPRRSPRRSPEYAAMLRHSRRPK